MDMRFIGFSFARNGQAQVAHGRRGRRVGEARKRKPM
jgi:hypothetical protein